MELDCESCRWAAEDEETGELYCTLELDEDDMAALLFEKPKTCRYYLPDPGEYGIVRHQN